MCKTYYIVTVQERIYFFFSFKESGNFGNRKMPSKNGGWMGVGFAKCLGRGGGETKIGKILLSSLWMAPNGILLCW